MKNAKNICQLIVKFIGREADTSELDALENQIKDNNKLLIFKKFAHTHFVINTAMTEYNLEEAKKSIQHKIKIAERRNRMQLIKRISVIACLVLVISLGYFTLRKQHNSLPTVLPIEIGKDKAIVTLANGNEIVLEEDRNFTNDDFKSDGKNIIYNAANSQTTEKIVYNFLATPRGGKFYMELADGTRVWLNADSKIKYPVNFIPGKDREVELVYGEAYFEVSPSTKHQGAKFNVRTQEQDITVLGTKFNVRAYANEKAIETTLLEGKIAVDNGKDAKVLQPNHQSLTYKAAQKIEVKQVEAWNRISWVNNQLVFEENSLGNIMKELSRWYNVDFVFESVDKKDFLFTGILERSRNIEEVLQLIEATSTKENLNFEIIDGIIIIK